MSDIVLSAGVRSNLLQLQQTSDLITSTQTKLATGKRVNSALDNPNNYFTAQGLDNRANDLNNLLDSMSTAHQYDSGRQQRHLGDHQAGAVRPVADQPGACRPPTPRPARASPAQFDALLTQIDQLAGDFGFNGINLLAGDNLTVTLNETGTSSTAVVGVDYTDATAAPLSITAAANNWAANGDITAASTDLTAALTTLRSESQTLGANLSTVQIRQDFTKATINTLQSGSAALTLADSNQEGANLLALQTRQQLSTTALSLASQADQNVLRLFR